jgi:hypothetical protein
LGKIGAMEVGAKFERIARRRAGGFCAAGKSRNTQIKIKKEMRNSNKIHIFAGCKKMIYRC